MLLSLFTLFTVIANGMNAFKIDLYSKTRVHCKNSLKMQHQNEDNYSLLNNYNILKNNLKFLTSFFIASSISFLDFNIDSAYADARLNAPTAAGTRYYCKSIIKSIKFHINKNFHIIIYRVNSDAESLLRYGLPINNKEVREIQNSVESIKSNLKTRRINFAKSG